MLRHRLRMGALVGATVISACTCNSGKHQGSTASTGTAGQTGTSSAGSTGNGGGSGAPDAGPIVAPQPLSPNIVVDQFGYRPAAEKIAVIRSPQKGFDSGMAFT